MDNEKTFKTVNLDTDFNASVDRLMELKKGRDENSIPLTDEYWKALNKHRLAHGGR